MRAMKDSGVEWIGEIPVDWKVGKVSYFFNVQLGKMLQPQQASPTDTLEYYLCAVNLGNNVLKTDTLKQMWFTESEKKVMAVRKGDLVVVEGGDVASSAIIEEELQDVYYQNALHRVRGTGKIDVRILRYLLITAKAQGHIDLICNKATIAHFSKDKFKSLPCIVAPESMQSRIANFLDAKCAQIDAIIGKQQQVIEKLKAYKQSVITEAVTKGLDPTVPMKDSGVWWVGAVPKHWKVGQLKYFSKIRSGITLGKKYPADVELRAFPYLRVANVQGEYTDLLNVTTINVPEDEAEKYLLHAGELLMTEGGDRDKLGRGCVWNGEIEVCLHQNHVFAVTTDAHKLDVHFLDYMTTSDVARNYFDYTAKKTTNLASTNSTIILEFRLPVPGLEEQKGIVECLDKKCAQINAVIAKETAVIDKLTDYKKSLIYEAVTGKMEV